MQIEFGEELAARISTAAQSYGYASPEEFIQDLIEKNLPPVAPNGLIPTSTAPVIASAEVEKTVVYQLPSFHLAAQDGSTEEVPMREINRRIKAGEITPDSLLWDEKTQGWCKAGEHELFARMFSPS